MDKQKILEIYKRCKEDPVYFISNFIKVVHPVRGLVPFKLYPFQEEIIRCLQTNRFNILRKFRQAGCTTISAAYSLWKATFQDHQTIPILSKGDLEATEVLERCKMMHSELPQFLQQPIVEDNKHTLKFKNSSVIKSRSSGKQSGRGLSGSLLIIDEAAFVENIRTIWAAVYPVISTGGSVFVLSTVNGVGNWYEETWRMAVAGENKFHAIDINWEDHPEYKRQAEGFDDLYEELAAKGLDIDEWELITRSNMPYKQWLQEYECAFLGTGDTFLEGSILERLTKEVDESYVSTYNNRMRVFQEPDPDRLYVMGIDISLGRQRDYSAFHVFDAYNGAQVAEFYSNRTPINEFSEIINTTGNLYNTALVLPERNTIGENLIDWLFNVYEYENIWAEEGSDKFGFQTTAKNREFILALLEEYIRSRKIKVNSRRTVNELLTFIIDDNNKIKADVGTHDDLVMSLAFACFALHTLKESGLTEMEPGIKKDSAPLLPSMLNKKYSDAAGNLTEEDYKWILGRN